jgi:hypothetical protein
VIAAGLKTLSNLVILPSPGPTLSIRSPIPTFILPLVEKIDLLSLQIIALDIKTPEVYTRPGVPIIVDGAIPNAGPYAVRSRSAPAHERLRSRPRHTGQAAHYRAPCPSKTALPAR